VARRRLEFRYGVIETLFTIHPIAIVAMEITGEIDAEQKCPHHDVFMGYGAKVTDGEPSWYCPHCEVDYTVQDLIVEGDTHVVDTFTVE